MGRSESQPPDRKLTTKGKNRKSPEMPRRHRPPREFSSAVSSGVSEGRESDEEDSRRRGLDRPPVSLGQEVRCLVFLIEIAI